MTALIATETVWLSIPSHDGYQVSSDGQVMSPRGLILKPWKSNRLGHLKIGLSLRKREWVHRVVCAAFYGPCPEGMEVRHLDGDPTNNRLENLKYGTRSENMQDRTRHGRVPRLYGDHCPRGHQYGPDRICWECHFVAKKRWVRESVGVYVECDKCGRAISKLNLTRHQTTLRCIGGA